MITLKDDIDVKEELKTAYIALEKAKIEVDIYESIIKQLNQ